MSAETLRTELVELAVREQLETLDHDLLLAMIGKKSLMTLLVMGMIYPCGRVDGHIVYSV